MNDKAVKLMGENSHCVISTVGPDGNPQSALVGFSFNDELEIVVGTYRHTRKYKNITKNPNVAIVIASEEKKFELQYEGTALELDDKELQKKVIGHYKDEATALDKLKDPTRVFFKIVPKWIRFVDANVEPTRYEERRFA